MEIFDTYFSDSLSALKEAKLNNKVLAQNKQVEATQICYYDGDILENAPRNCINVKLDDFVSYFVNTKNRIPTRIQTQNKLLKEEFEKKLIFIDEQITKNIQILEEKTKNKIPNFKDKKLRIFAHACRETILIKHQIISIMNSAKSLGFEVHIHKQNSDLQSCSRLAYLEAFSEFNPHITVSINHINNKHLNDSVYNFVWFQDYLSTLLDNSSLLKRKNDIVLHLAKGLGRYIKNKGIESIYRPFCIDTKIYKKRAEIKKDKKIIFIGSSYKKNFDDINDERKHGICNEVFSLYLKNGYITSKKRLELNKKYALMNNGLGHIINYIERDLSLEYIINMDLEYEIEVYGHGWESTDTIAPKHKGSLLYGEQISKVYNSAEYCLVIGGYIMQQRTLEAAASGSVPLIFDSRRSNADILEKEFEDNVVFMNTLNDLPSILDKKYDLDLSKLIEKNTYDCFVENIICKLNER